MHSIVILLYTPYEGLYEVTAFDDDNLAAKAHRLPRRPCQPLRYCYSAMPRRLISAAASTRPPTPSLARMLETWTLAVFALMKRILAISGLERPSATKSATSRSRSVRPNRDSLSVGAGGSAAGAGLTRALRVKAAASAASAAAPSCRGCFWGVPPRVRCRGRPRLAVLAYLPADGAGVLGRHECLVGPEPGSGGLQRRRGTPDLVASLRDPFRDHLAVSAEHHRLVRLGSHSQPCHRPAAARPLQMVTARPGATAFRAAAASPRPSATRALT